jgi:peptide deformylase
MNSNTGALNLIKYPNPILNEKSVECTKDDLDLILGLKVPMYKLMREHKGIGLAAVQIGILKRFCTILINGKCHVLINPVILDESEEKENKQEGCLSLPLFWNFIERPLDITVEYLDENFEKKKAVFEGLEARCLTHEIDHMDGITQDQKLSNMVLQMWKKKLKKAGIL